MLKRANKKEQERHRRFHLLFACLMIMVLLETAGIKKNTSIDFIHNVVRFQAKLNELHGLLYTPHLHFQRLTLKLLEETTVFYGMCDVSSRTES